jgi:hypothetical protein
MKIAVTRRKLLKTLLALGVGSVFSSCLTGFAGSLEKIPVKSGDGKPSLETFTALSSLVTLHDDLDPETVKKMHAVFMDEPWGPDHIVRLHRKIVEGLAKRIDRKKHPLGQDGAWKLDEGEKWFAGHLLTTWYLGIYYHGERPTQRITFENALMFKAVEGLLPVPYLQPVGFGKWAEPPEDQP